MNSDVGELLKAWRKQQKLTRKHLSHQAGISRATLSRWEAGQTQPRMAELEALLTVLQVSSTQRQVALALVNAPRAVQRLHEVKGAGPPLRGDLLRAMRVRQGWTQQETAKRAGMAQGTLARWEQSEDWPSTERLHTLCYALHAQEAELIALTRGSVMADVPRQATLDRATVRETVAQHMLHSSLADVEFLAVEAQLWHLSQREEAAKLELSYAYGCHARFLVEHQRFPEATVYVARTKQLAQSGYRDDIGWSAAVIAASRIAGVGKLRPNPKRAMKLLREGIEDPFLAGRLEYRAWMRSEIAKYLVTLGEAESALQVSQQAIRVADEVDTVEPWFRRGDHARVLLKMGRGGEALEECNSYLSLGHPPLETLSFMLTGAQALVAICRGREAANWLQQMESIIDNHPEAAHYRTSTEALQQRLLQGFTL